MDPLYLRLIVASFMVSVFVMLFLVWIFIEILTIKSKLTRRANTPRYRKNKSVPGQVSPSRKISTKSKRE